MNRRTRPPLPATSAPGVQRYEMAMPGIHVEVDEPIPMHNRLGAFIGDATIPVGTPIRIVHVMSTHSRGEIRGYVLIEGRLYLRIPCSVGAWAQMDVAVSAAVNAPIVPYIAVPEKGASWFRIAPRGTS